MSHNISHNSYARGLLCRYQYLSTNNILWTYRHVIYLYIYYNINPCKSYRFMSHNISHNSYARGFVVLCFVFSFCSYIITLPWRHNGTDSVSNHQPYDCLLNRLFRRRSKNKSKLCVTGLCAGNSPGAGEFSAQMASYAENVSIWWRHHELSVNLRDVTTLIPQGCFIGTGKPPATGKHGKART